MQAWRSGGEEVFACPGGTASIRSICTWHVMPSTTAKYSELGRAVPMSSDGGVQSSNVAGALTQEQVVHPEDSAGMFVPSSVSHASAEEQHVMTVSLSPLATAKLFITQQHIGIATASSRRMHWWVTPYRRERMMPVVYPRSGLGPTEDIRVRRAEA
jgi:hypothetical protein